jgi:hypothetical protein
MKKNKEPRKKISKTKKIIIWCVVGLFAGALLFNIIEIIINLTYRRIKDETDITIQDLGRVGNLLHYFENPDIAEEEGITIDNEFIVYSLKPAKEYIDGRYDTADFNMPVMLRLQYLFGDVIADISPEGSRMLKETFLNAKYWMTEPGEDSMCYWSENHQILLAVSEYMAGRLWSNEIFTNDGATGAEHMRRARQRINYWMEHRYNYGFAEFNSANYAPFNIGPMSNFIQFAAPEDKDMAERMKIIMDLLLYDLASNMYNYVYMAPAARAYASNMVGITGDRMRRVTNYIWQLGDEEDAARHRMLINFISMTQATDEEGNAYYEVPQVIIEIGKERNATRIIKSSSGLNVDEMAQKGYVGMSDEQIMMQLGMEAFTNPEVLQNTIRYISKHKMFRNDFLNDFRYMNMTLIKYTGLASAISKNLNPMPNGIALQRGNIYTYRTPNYQLATAQAYHPGSYGATQMLSIANFTEKAVVFTTHPARFASEKNAAAFPGYWAGYGRAPHSVQHENMQMSIYKLPKKSGFLELYDVPQFTHTYLPEAFFDEVSVQGRYAFARVGGAYLALIGGSDLEYLAHDNATAKALKCGLEDYPDKKFDLVQRGLKQFWIYELSDASKESFADFQQRIKSNTVRFDGENNLTYASGAKNFALQYGGVFSVNGAVQQLEYKRYDCEFIVAERQAEQLDFNFEGHFLSVNYNQATRSYN